ncbi:MAG: thiamine-phosphate kinase [Wenzhouxiangella sp.]|nr:MAG: thiamine-phosphate kinase [Wenzhouxiangella sp.]
MPIDSRVEFDLIARIRARAGPGDPDLLVGIGDDAAVFLPTPGLALVSTTDSLVAGRHFRPDWSAADLGHLALAANLSDLAAMGARSRWALLSLTLPAADPVWLDGFLDGFLALAQSTRTTLIGGNLASGPLNLGVQLIGEVEPERIARRGGAREGDRILVTGSLGDAAAALELSERAGPELERRLRRPEPRLAAGRRLAGRVSALIDVSDGLLADLGHLLPPGSGAEIELGQLPASRALSAAFADPEQRWPLQLGGGNDYELLMTAAPGQVPVLAARMEELGLELSDIGTLTGRAGLRCLRPDGSVLDPASIGWDHFAD